MDTLGFDIANAMQEHGKLNRKLNQAEAKLSAKLASLQEKHQAATADDTHRLEELTIKILAYAESHKDELTGGKGQTAKIGTGCIKWRKGKPSVRITGDAAAIIQALRRRKLSRFIRVSEELDKAAILADSEALAARPIDGLEIVPAIEKVSIES